MLSRLIFDVFCYRRRAVSLLGPYWNCFTDFRYYQNYTRFYDLITLIQLISLKIKEFPSFQSNDIESVYKKEMENLLAYLQNNEWKSIRKSSFFYLFRHIFRRNNSWKANDTRRRFHVRFYHHLHSQVSYFVCWKYLPIFLLLLLIIKYSLSSIHSHIFQCFSMEFFRIMEILKQEVEFLSYQAAAMLICKF